MLFWMYACVLVFVCVCIYICIHAENFSCVYTYICIHVCKYVYWLSVYKHTSCVNICIPENCVGFYVHKYIQIHIFHVHICIQRLLKRWPQIPRAHRPCQEQLARFLSRSVGRHRSQAMASFRESESPAAVAWGRLS